MADLTVDTDYLEDLAATQNEAAGYAAQAAQATSEIGHKLNWTHGVISTASNGAFASAEVSRRNAGLALQQASEDLAEKLLAGGVMFKGVDEDLSINLDRQMLDR